MFEKGDIMETIRNVDVNRLHDFKNHPFKVEMNTELCELMRSIEKEGVLVPLLVRTNPYGDGYEVISGHRRKEAAIWAGETKVPVVIRELDDDQAVVAMVDSNLHRENLKPSEKAFAYKMKLDAMKHQGKHLDSGALAQVGPKFTDGSQLNEKGNNTSTINSNELLARQVGESVAQIKRYIRLTKLIPKILDMVDDGKIAFTIAVELSYLSEKSEKTITEEGLKSIESNSIDGISVLTGCIGWDMGNVAMCNSRCATNQQINAIIDFNHKLVDPRYVYYWLKGKKDYLFSIASVTRTPILSKSVFENIDIPLPSLKIQERVTKLLSLIDEKIRKNHQINDYLSYQSSMVV